jgi:phosphopantetheinyl transferase
MPQIYFAHRALDGEPGHDVGRALLAQLYETHIGQRLPPIAVTDLGKPYFENSSWHFSISHTKTHAFCVLADVPVGVDAEALCRQVNPKLAQQVLSAGERAQYDAAADKNRAFLTFWVLKEADAKRTGKGLGFHPNHTDFRLSDPRVFEVDDHLVAIVYFVAPPTARQSEIFP